MVGSRSAKKLFEILSISTTYPKLIALRFSLTLKTTWKKADRDRGLTLGLRGRQKGQVTYKHRRDRIQLFRRGRNYLEIFKEPFWPRPIINYPHFNYILFNIVRASSALGRILSSLSISRMNYCIRELQSSGTTGRMPLPTANRTAFGLVDRLAQ